MLVANIINGKNMLLNASNKYEQNNNTIRHTAI